MAGGRTNKRTEVPCVLQDIVPFGAAAQKWLKNYEEKNIVDLVSSEVVKAKR